MDIVKLNIDERGFIKKVSIKNGNNQLSPILDSYLIRA